MTRDDEKKNQAAASELLVQHWNAWCDAHETCAAAKREYEQRARVLGIQLCDGCNKPMPEYDSSQYCDGCKLPWGWSTPEGQRALRASELDQKIAAMQAERAKL